VKKAREALGDRAPQFKSYGSRPGGHDGSGVLGKRRRDDDEAESSGGDVPDDVRRIPMPRDTPPPIPKEALDEWYAKRRARRAAQATNANQEPLGESKERDVGRGQRQRSEPAVSVEAKTVYEAKPVIRDLKKEAVSAFMPTAVRMKIDKVKGQGGLLEPEEADRLEKEGYLTGQSLAGAAAPDIGATVVDRKEPAPLRRAMVEDAEDED
jgi:hypothetical protein